MGLALLATLPETPARAQQELDLQLALGPALVTTESWAAPEVEQTYTRARELCRQVGEMPQLFPTPRGLCWFYLARGAQQTARELGEQLDRLAQRAAAPTPRLEAHDALGSILFYLGEYGAARTHLEQRSLATISIITVLRRDDNLKGHIHRGLDVGLTPEQLIEVMLQLLFYTGAPIANTALRIADEVFEERGIQVSPYQVYNPNEDPAELYRRGLTKRREVMGETFAGNFEAGDEVDRDWERYLVEYLWGSVWTRLGLDLPSRCLCTLTALTEVGTERAIGHYIRAALRLGFSEAQIKELFFHLSFYIGVSLARRGSAIARQIFNSR